MLFFYNITLSNHAAGVGGIYISLKYSVIYTGYEPLTVLIDAFKHMKLSNNTISALIIVVALHPLYGTTLGNALKSIYIGI